MSRDSTQLLVRGPGEQSAHPPDEGSPPGDGKASVTRSLLGRLAAIRGRHITIAVILILLGYLVLVPLGFLLYRTFFGLDGTFTLEGFGRAFAWNQSTFDLVGNTMVFAIASAVLALVIGTTFAYLSERTDVPFRKLLALSALIPLIIPSILYAPAWVFLASPRIGLLNAMTEAVAGVRPFDIYTMAGMVWAQALHVAPLAFLLMSAAFRASDPSLEEAARTAGLSRYRVIRHITLPMVRPALASASLILFILSLEVFEVPAILGLPSGIYVMTSRLYQLNGQFPIDYPAIGAIGFALLVIAMLGVVLAAKAGGSLRQTGTISGKAFRPRREALGRLRPWFGGVVVFYFVLAVALPLTILVYASFLPHYQQPGPGVLGSLSLDNYRAMIEIPSIITAFTNTILVGLGTATAVMLIAAVAAWVVVRTNLKGRRLIDGLAFSPIVVPGLVFGVALAVVYLRVPIPIYGTLFILVIAYVTRFLPYAMRYASSAFATISKELEESAYVAGAGWFTTMRRVLIPLATPGIAAGWIFVLIVCFRELQSSILLYTPGQEVVSILIYQEYMDGRMTLVATIGVVLVALLIVIVSASQILASRRGVRVE